MGPCTNTPTSKLTGENSLLIYPNPASDVLNIRSKRSFAQSTTLDLLDPYGRPVRKAEIPAGESISTVNLQGLAPGAYALRWQDEKGALKVKMVVVQ